MVLAGQCFVCADPYMYLLSEQAIIPPMRIPTTETAACKLTQLTSHAHVLSPLNQMTQIPVRCHIDSG